MVTMSSTLQYYMYDYYFIVCFSVCQPIWYRQQGPIAQRYSTHAQTVTNTYDFYNGDIWWQQHRQRWTAAAVQKEQQLW